ncbi:MAG: hypothetical protein KAI64_04510, partial [Thermoplasmata archaeon]|nr:hypothetical protein [Thermoplasmata archaeon]
PNTWTPGDFRGGKFESSVSFMKPGASDSTTFSVENTNPASGITLNITDSVFKKMDELSYVVKMNKTKAHWSIVYVTNYLKHKLTSPGILNMTDNEEYKLSDINETLWLNTELLKVSAVSNQTFVDPNLDGTLDSQYSLDIYDWTCIDPCDEPNPITPGEAGEFQGIEANRINYDHPNSNTLEVRIHNPAQRIHDALWISVRPLLGDVDDIEYRVTLEFYGKTDWNWLDVDSQLTVGPASTGEFDADLTVPPGTPIGSYEGAIYLNTTMGHSNETTWGLDNYPKEHILLQRDNVISAKVYRNSTLLPDNPTNYILYPNIGVIKLAQNITSTDSITVDYWFYNVTTIPILVNVPAESVDFSFGGNAPGQDELFMNKVNGGFGGGGKTGDWRFYFIDLPDQGLFSSGSAKFHLDISWENNLTDLDAFSFGEGGFNPAGVQYSSERYGPVLFMKNNGGSDETAAFYTTTNSNKEVIFSPLTGGLNIIAVHNVKMNGVVHEENIQG